jgi:acetoacetyl-CoA synthetase
MDRPLWQPSPGRIRAANITALAERVAAEHGEELRDYARLRAWSADHSDHFWPALWRFADVIFSEKWESVLEHGDTMPGARWFPGARLNFAENLLRHQDSRPAIIGWTEDGRRSEISHRDLHRRVAELASALRTDGVGPGDRVAAVLPHAPETIIAMLAATSLGAVWSSCSPDFGAQGILDRFGQIEPKVLFVVGGYRYNGKVQDIRSKLDEIRRRLPTVARTVVLPFLGPDDDPGPPEGAVALADYVDSDATDITFAQLPFDHPLYVLYSSGTTGVPKAIVHGAGGTLLQHLKELILHTDIKPEDRLFYFTTCGWMMWNWQVSALATGAAVVTYDGSPFHPDGRRLFDLVEKDRVTVFGTSAKYIDAVKKAGLEPAKSHDLGSLRAILSTGSPLVPESFDFVYGSIKEDLHLASISGGTDIVSCFVLGAPVLPVWRGEIQSAGLGMAVDVYDDDGRSVTGEQGELVCTRPFPSMPVGFWNDADGSRYRAAYFERFPGIWHHGDMIERTAHDGFVIYGRSDAVLNPGGVRIGTAEIYRQVEQIEEVQEAICIGQQWDGDVRVVLFVRLRDGGSLDDDLVNRIRRRIRSECSPRHVPARVLAVDDIPRTMNGKIAEIAVRDVVHGREVKNTDALANPEALELFRDLDALKS